MLIQITLIIIGFILLLKGADILVEGASVIAKKMHISEIVIGLTIVSIGTSMPEVFVSVTSTMQGYSDMSLGNIIGSNICNLLLVLGISSLIRPIKFQKQIKWIDNFLSIIITIIFVVICNTNLEIDRIEGCILITLFSFFLIYTVVIGIKNKRYEPIVEIIQTKKISMIKNIMLIILGIVILKIGGAFVVDNAAEVARGFNVSEKVISLTIIAIGTSLPELVTSVIAAVKGDSDIAIGNIVGSNVFNMLLIIGGAAIINPIEYNLTYNTQMVTLLVGTVIMSIFPFITPKDEMSRSNGILFVVLYFIYLMELILH